MKRSIRMITLVIVATAASGTAAASAERGDDVRTKARPSHAPTFGVLDASLKSLRLEGTDRFDKDSDGKNHKHKALGKFRWDRARSTGHLFDEDFAERRAAGFHPRASGPTPAYTIPGDYSIPATHPAPSQPIPEPISAILFASGALIVGYSVRRPLGSSD